MSFARIFCINLLRRNDRLRRFLIEFPDIWMSKLCIFSAIDGTSHILTDIDRHKLRNANWDINQGRAQWGCSFSHEQVWRRIVGEKLPYTIILEDDALFIGLEYGLEAVLKSVRSLNLDLCFLGPVNHPENTRNMPHIFTDLVDPNICRISSNLGTMSYVISLKGAADLLQIIETKGHYRAIDQIINDYLKERNQWFCSKPLFSINIGLGSDIQPVSSWKSVTS